MEDTIIKPEGSKALLLHNDPIRSRPKSKEIIL
jgi:hypothetical protein